MSRTYRKRNCSYEYKCVLTDWAVLYEYTGSRRQINRHSKEGRRLLAEYHGDYTKRSGFTLFRKQLERSMRQKAHNQLHRYLRDNEYVVMIDHKHRHSALMFWW